MMKNQIGLADIEYANRKRRTKRDEFLEMMDEIIPWEEWVAVVSPYYFSSKRGRPPRGIEIMLRMYLLANWFNLSDEGIEDAIYDSYAFRKFMGVDFHEIEQVPDATTLCKFRKIMNDNGVTKLLFDTIKRFLDRHGKMMHGGSIVDASIIDAPASTKNEEKARDPEMHQAKKGNQWYFGAKLHVGVDSGTGYFHSLEVTPANVADITVAAGLLREDDEVVYGDSAYSGIEKRDEVRTDERLSSIDYRVNSKKPYRKYKWESGPGIYWHRQLEYQKSRVRCKVEYSFLILKQIFGYRKVRYRGLHKNKSHAYMLCASANLYMLGKSGWCMMT
jgi:IS5 family transposase